MVSKVVVGLQKGMEKMMKKIGFIGVGVMGKSMVRNLTAAGYEVEIYTRTKSKVEDLIAEGITWCDSVKECVSDCDVVITIVGYPKDVEEVYFGENGILSSVKENTYLIDMTTTSPKLSERIYETAKGMNCYALDAPVSGGDTGAKNKTLSIMVGGEKDVFVQCMEIFEAMGSTIIYEGKAGSGQHTKMANQIAIAGAMSGTCESIAYAKNAGLSLDVMLDSITKGAAGSWQLSNMGPKIVAEDFAPGFFMKHFIKDMKIAKEEAQARGLELPMLNTVLSVYEMLEKEGLGDYGTQILIKHYPM